MHKLKTLFILLLTTVLLASCTSPVKNELFNYINVDLAEITPIEEEVIKEYEKVISDDTNSSRELAEIFENTIIPKYSDFVARLKRINPSTKEIASLHATYIKGAEKQLESFTFFKDGFSEKNNEKIIKANELLKEANDSIETFKKGLEILSKKYYD